MRSLPVLHRPSAVAVLTLLALTGCGGDTSDGTAAGGGDATVQPAPSGSAEEPSAGPSSTAPPSTGSSSPGSTPSDSGAAPPGAPDPAADAEPGDEPADPPFEANTRPDTEEPVGNGLTVTDVEVGTHLGYDRVVFTLGGEGAPGWRVEYTDSPTRQGSGHPFTPAGDAFLSVLISGVGYPFDTGVEEYDGPASIPGGSARVVREVQVQGVFEGQYDAAVGLAAERPFRVFRLEDPPRVVIDVAHRG